MGGRVHHILVIWYEVLYLSNTALRVKLLGCSAFSSLTKSKENGGGYPLISFSGKQLIEEMIILIGTVHFPICFGYNVVFGLLILFDYC